MRRAVRDHAMRGRGAPARSIADQVTRGRSRPDTEACGHRLLADVAVVAAEGVAASYSANPATSKKAAAEVLRFVRYAAGSGLTYVDEFTAELVDGFLWSASGRQGCFADVSASTAANRQAFVRRFFAVLADLGEWDGGDITGSPIPRNSSEPSRVLTSEELASIRAFADSGLATGRRALLVVLAEAGGDAAEIAQVTVDDVDLDAATVRFRGPAARINPLTEWGRATTRTVLRTAEPPSGLRLCVSNEISLERAAHSVTVRLREVLADAGLASRPRVTPRSIRLTIARQVLDTGAVEAAARFLGNESLDATARMLDHRWREQ